MFSVFQGFLDSSRNKFMALIALGVSGGIGVYKAVEVARGLQKRGHEVAAVMTRSAQRFVGTVTFEAITRRRVITDQFAEGANSDIEHISLATNASLLLVAPATANIIGKFANGIAGRLPHVPLPRHPRAGADGPGNEHEHARARGGSRQHGGASRSRREIHRTG